MPTTTNGNSPEVNVPVYPSQVRKTKRTGKPVIRTCQWCEQPFNATQMLYHKYHCPKKPEMGSAAKPSSVKQGGWQSVVTCSFCGKEIRYHAIQQHWNSHCPSAPPLDEGTRRCSKCQTPKPVSKFVGRRNQHYGMPSRVCVECRSDSLHDWRMEIGSSQKTVNRSPQAKRKQKARSLKWSYGLSLEEYERMLAAQSGVCAICGNPPLKTSVQNMSLHVDHDHAAASVAGNGQMKIRSLLCSQCNCGLGAFRDSPALLIAAINYLAVHQGIGIVT